MASQTLALGMLSNNSSELSNNSSEQNVAGLKVGLRQHTVGGKMDEPSVEKPPQEAGCLLWELFG